MPYPSETELTTVERVKWWCRINEDDATQDSEILELIIRVSAFMTQMIGRDKWIAGEVTEVRNGDGTDFIVPKITPINSVISVSIDNYAVSNAINVLNPGVSWDTDFIFLNGYRFERGFQNVTIVYNGGLPQDSLKFKVLEQACLEIINKKWDRRKHPDQTGQHSGNQIIAQFAKDDIPAEAWLVINSLKNTIPVY